MLASELITRALRLINVPGRGGVLSSADVDAGLTTLQEILDTDSVARAFVPGTRRHFFSLPAKGIVTYGPGGDLDTNLFDDPLPMAIEVAFIRGGATITNNEQVDEYEFNAVGSWTGTADILNGMAYFDDAETLTQSLSLVAGTTYVLRLQVVQLAGDIVVQVQQNGVDLVNQTISESGEYEFTFTFTTTLPTITFTTDDAADEIQVLYASILEQNKDRVELSEGGSDYPVRIVDQKNYNSRFNKGTASRPTKLRYSRDYPLARIYFNLVPSNGEILVLEANVNRVAVDGLSAEIRMHPEAIKYVRYKLANELAPEFGKELTRSQQRTLSEAENLLLAADTSDNTLGVDPGLRFRQQRFNIEAGDP